MDNKVEQAYWDHILQMTGMERVQRTVSLYDSIVRMLRYQVSQQHPELTEDEVRLWTAGILYQSEPETMALLRQAGLPEGAGIE